MQQEDLNHQERMRQIAREVIAPPAAPPQRRYVSERVSRSPGLRAIPEALVERVQDPVVKEATAPPAAPSHTIPERSINAQVASLYEGMCRWYSKAPIESAVAGGPLKGPSRGASVSGKAYGNAPSKGRGTLPQEYMFMGLSKDLPGGKVVEPYVAPAEDSTDGG